MGCINPVQPMADSVYSKTRRDRLVLSACAFALAVAFAAQPYSVTASDDGVSVAPKAAQAAKGSGKDGSGDDNSGRRGGRDRADDNPDGDDGTADQGSGDAPGTGDAGDDDGTADQGPGDN